MKKILLLPFGFLVFLNCSNRSQSADQENSTASEPVVEILAQNLEVPWGMDFLPDGRLLFNERPGRIKSLNLKTKEVKLLMTRNIWDRAEGGLLGLAVDPLFEQNHFVFIYETHETGNRIVRLKFQDEILSENKVLLDSIPKKLFHDGGILRFGPDGYLYAGTGDARTPENAQDINSLSGKILRMDREGNVPPDNPRLTDSFGQAYINYVWSYGHRNVQGLCWDDNGRMYASEHGPSGELNGWCCHDELNIIEKGGNYGWPFVIGNDEKDNCINPIMHSGEDTWAPGGIVYLGNDVITIACLRGERLIRFDFYHYYHNRNLVEEPDILTLYTGIYGRLRNVIKTPEGDLIFCSSNQDGRGDAKEGDDKIYLVTMGE